MVYLYATMTNSEYYLKGGKRLDPELDNSYLRGKVVVMDEEFFLRFALDFKNVRIVTIGKNDLSNHFDVESYKDVNSVIESFRILNKEKDLYFMGKPEFLKQVVPYAGGIVVNIVDDYVENIDNIYFPNFDSHNFKTIKKSRVSSQIHPNILRVTSLRVFPYGYKDKIPKKRQRKK